MDDNHSYYGRDFKPYTEDYKVHHIMLDEYVKKSVENLMQHNQIEAEKFEKSIAKLNRFLNKVIKLNNLKMPDSKPLKLTEIENEIDDEF